MKKLLLVAVASFCLSVVMKANNADLFSYDKNAVNTELSDLQTLEEYVNSNPGVTLTDLQLNSNQLVSELNMDANTFGGLLASFEPPLGVPSFVWGCVFGVAGIAIVYFVADDKEETKKAFKGCVVGALVYTVFYVVYVVAIVSTASTTTY